MADKILYCEDCKWEKHQFATKDRYPKCSHPAHRQGNTYERRKSDKERWSYCSHMNNYGRCQYFSAKEPIDPFGIISNLRTIFREWRK